MNNGVLVVPLNSLLDVSGKLFCFGRSAPDDGEMLSRKRLNGGAMERIAKEVDTIIHCLRDDDREREGESPVVGSESFDAGESRLLEQHLPLFC